MAKKKCLPKTILAKIENRFADDQEVLDALKKLKVCRDTPPYALKMGKCMKESKQIESVKKRMRHCSKEIKKGKY
jgi:hypothetical protein